ncbi:hypothetical protein DL766_006352 [Monosporascus sp. MC13-8B]|nr:hypothetical protein DL763_008301 [Monosporascus cannonballus]RYP27515.1 hypothetical protein DL766_006352 [Monosporascus sp. MC13-8B]
MLNIASAKGRVDELQKCLNGIPPGLDNLFEMILTRDHQEMQAFRLYVQWILFAKRPLKLVEYFFAIRSPSSQEASRSRATGDVSTEDMCRFVHSSSKGLAEVTKTRNKDKMPAIQFIHESVRDFFLIRHGDRRLWPNIDGRTGSSTLANLLQSANPPRPMISSQMKLDIIKHDPPNEFLPKASSPEASSLRRSVFDELPFLEYAVHHVLYHADAAEDAIQQENFIKDFPIKYWIYLDNLFERRQIRHHTPSASLFQPPVLYAAENGYEGVVKLLLETGKVDANSKDRFNRTPLSYAAANGHGMNDRGHEGIVELLLETGKVNADSKDKGGQIPLSYAAENGHKGIFKLLFGTGKVDVDSKDMFDRTPLSYAAQKRP